MSDDLKGWAGYSEAAESEELAQELHLDELGRGIITDALLDAVEYGRAVGKREARDLAESLVRRLLDQSTELALSAASATRSRRGALLAEAQSVSGLAAEVADLADAISGDKPGTTRDRIEGAIDDERAA